MKKLFAKISLVLLIATCVVMTCLVLPPTDISRNYLLFAEMDKNTLLANTPGQRIIFIGGSNLSFGLNSELIRDSLHINPVNTALHAGVGLNYMLLHPVKHIRENDIVVLSPEYQQFYGDLSDGQAELLTVIIDVSPGSTDLSFRQYVKLIPHFPKYASSKLRLWHYLKKADSTTVGIYDRRSFNRYGDAYIHWKLPKQHVTPFDPIRGDLNEDVFTSLNKFRKMVEARKAYFFITFPCCQELSFKQSLEQIRKIETRLKAYGFNFLGTPERYVFPDSLMFNTPYHPIKRGVDYRTTLLIEDLKKTTAGDPLRTGGQALKN